MDAGMQLQSFAHRQPRTPQAERLVAALPPCLRSPELPPVMSIQTTQMRGDVLQMHESLLERLSWCRRVRRRALTGLHDLVHGDFLMLDLMPEPAQRRQRHRRGVEGPADAPLPACDPTRQRLFLSKAEQGKLADLTQILGDHIVGLRVRRVEVLLRRRVRHRASACCCGLLPRALVERQRTEDVIVVRQRGTVYVVVSECTRVWERFLCLRGEPYPSLQRFVFVYSLHRYRLLALGVPATVMAAWHLAQHDPSATVVPPTLFGVCHDCGRDGRWDTAHDL